jgi:hypothetical protein
MDGKMKGMIMAGMMALSLVLGAMAIFSNEWLTEDDEGATVDTGLSNQVMVMDTETSDMCDAMAPMYEELLEGATVECDGAEMTLTIGISDLCESMKDGDSESDDLDDCEAAALAGTMGQIGMWGGVVFALLATLMLVLPMAGVDAMDAIPEMGQKVISWGAGGLMLLGMVLWYFMLPDGDSSMGTGLWIAGAAMSIALGSTLIGQFIPSDE